MTASSDGDPTTTVRGAADGIGGVARPLAALGLAFGGFAVIGGSFANWGVCPKIPCEGDFGLFSLFERSGIDFGPGVVTAMLGLLLALTGLYAIRRRGVLPFATLPLVAAALVLLIIGAYVVRVHFFPEFSIDGPSLGVYFVAGGGAIAAVASARLKQARPP
jgi:hypothetical protein